MKPLTDNLENDILDILSNHGTMSSNELHQKLRVNKKRYTDTKNNMIRQEFIREKTRGNRKYLSRVNFEDEKFKGSEYAMMARVNCNNYLRNLKSIKPIGILRKDRYVLKKNAKKLLDAIFFQLDTIHIICTRLEYAKSFGLMTGTSAKRHKNKCLDLFDVIMESLFSDHKKFKDEIINHYQSQVRTMRFKV